MSTQDNFFQRFRADIKARFSTCDAIQSDFLLHGLFVGICLAGRSKL